MSTIMIKFPKDRVQELKGMVSEGLHIFGRVMSEVEQMCRESETYGDRMPYMGDRYGGNYGNRDYMDYGNKMPMHMPMHMPPHMPYYHY